MNSIFIVFSKSKIYQKSCCDSKGWKSEPAYHLKINEFILGQIRRSRSSTPANGETGVSCRSRPADDKTSPTTSSKNGSDADDAALTTLNTEVHYDDESFLSLVTNSSKSNDSTPSKSDALLVQELQQQKCKFCDQVVHRTDFQEHILSSHRTEILEQISSKKYSENECPDCSFKSADEDQDLVTHFVASHFVQNRCHDDSDASDAESDVSGKATPASLTANGPKVTSKTHRRFGRKGDHDKPKNFVEFCRQVEQNLRTENGKFATAVDERSVRCVCGKVVRTCGKFYWKYLVQRPTVKNGQIIQKGHWFTCPVVIEFKSLIPPWVVTEQELEASKIDSNVTRSNGIDAVDCDADKRRAGRKRVQAEKDPDQPTSKRARDDNNDASDDASDDSDDGSEDEVDPEIGETQAKYRVKKWVSERLLRRMAGDTFLQDGPCFQVKILLTKHY